MKQIITLFLLTIGALELRAQGCSDAGVCKLGSLKPDANYSMIQHDNKLEAGISVGAADYGIGVFGGHIGYSRQLGDHWSIDTKATFLFQSGNGISAIGAGDIFANVNYRISQKFTLTGGVKVPLMKADRDEEGLPLPMDYQSSLGTFDLLAGTRYQTDKWQWALAVQIPLEQNDNAFIPGFFPAGSIINDIQATNAFQRQADIMLHISRTIPMSDKITFTPGLLPIYHVGEDEYTGIDGRQYSIDGSDGLTLNGTVYINVEVGSSGNFEFDLGFPFIVREARPEGLTRSFVFGVNYSHGF
jgi:hypothetical protein